MKRSLHVSTDGCSTFGLELCVCTRCGALLTRYDFNFDELGRTIENCGHCGPALLAVRRGALVVGSRTLAPKSCGKCVDCKTPLTYTAGGIPLRCKRCQKARRRVESREYKREVSRGARVVASRRFSA